MDRQYPDKKWSNVSRWYKSNNLCIIKIVKVYLDSMLTKYQLVKLLLQLMSDNRLNMFRIKLVFFSMGNIVNLLF